MTYARSRSRIGARPRITRYARNNADTKALSNPLLQLPLYAGFWGDDPAWTNNPGVGQAVSSWRNGGTLAASGAYLDPTLGLVLPGVAGNYASVPDAAALDITGGICMVARMALDDWTPATSPTPIGKWVSTGNQRSFAMAISTAGVPQVWFSTDGTAGTAQFLNANNAATPVPASNGETVWVAVTAAASGGNTVLTSWTSSDGVTWTQLGATRTAAVAYSIFAGSALLEFGSNNVGTAGNLDGALSVARVYSGSGFSAAGPSGTLVLDVDFRRTSVGAFTCSTGQTVTVASTFNALQATAGSRPTLTTSALLGGRRVVDFDGTDDRLEITTGVSLAQPFEVWAIVTYDAVGGSNRNMQVGLLSTATTRGVFHVSAPSWYAAMAGSGLTAGTPAANTPYLSRVLFDNTSSVLSVNGSATSGSVGASTAIDQIVIGAGRLAPSTYAVPLDGKIAFLGILPAASITATHRRQFALWAASFYSVPGFAAAA